MTPSTFGSTLVSRIALTLFSASIAGGLVGCGPGMKSNNACEGTVCSAKTEGSNAVPAPVVDPWKDVDLEGKIATGPYSGKFIGLDKNNQTISIRLPLPDVTGAIAVTGPIPELPGASFGIDEDSAGKWFIGVTVPLKYIVRGVELGEPRALPNGDPLPGVPSGELPSVGLKITKGSWDINLYLGINAAAIFVPTPKVNPFVSLIFPLKTEAKKLVGYFATVAQKGPFPGGFYVSTIIPDSIARVIDSIL